MKNTINLQKIEKTTIDLLEIALTKIVKELKIRSFNTVDRAMDTGNIEAKDLYSTRMNAFRQIEHITESIPKRTKWVE